MSGRTIESRLDALELGQAEMKLALKFQDKLLWGLYGVAGSFVVFFMTYLALR